MPAKKRKTVAPAPALNSAVRVGRLDTLAGVLRETGRVYRAARRGEITTTDAAKLTYILGSLRLAIEGGEMERRVAALEGDNDGL